MSVLLVPHLTFRCAQAREALEFYRSVLGGELCLVTSIDPGTEGPHTRVLHGRLTTAGGITLTGADAPETAQVTVGDNVSVNLSGGPGEADVLRGWFAALSDRGEVRRPMATAPWGGELGMLVDRFGVSWLVDVGGTPTP